ncbi:hypothetical protein GCM10009092_09400 [Bowmanella denitrificans]|uniref:Peptidase M15C domain-containing protein n=1 Tax=Bowmanella denitrificans TaxID=366582 RepID=A0ABN0WUQ8_9ALTE|nr:M15 family metallopeptidase [Bowmanella denitrificans]
MASRDLNDLVPEVKVKAQQVIQFCRDVGGFDLLIYCTLRPLQEQARLYRQSRARAEIEDKQNKFRQRGFGFLADIIHQVGPCYGRHVTNAAPGESWHNYGEAWDAVPLLGGKPEWSYVDAKEHWDIYGQGVREVGMHWAGDWQSFREFPHAQLRPGGNPLKTQQPDELLAILRGNGLLAEGMLV